MKAAENLQRDYALICAELCRSFRLLKVYPLDTVNSIISFIIVSTIFMVGIRAVGDSSQIFGVVFFPVMLNLISGPSSSIRNDIEMGVFEQVYISGYSLLKVAVIRTVVSGIISLIGSLIIAVIMHVFFVKITFSPLHMLILFIFFGVQSLLLGIMLNSLNLFIMILLVMPLLSVSVKLMYLPSLVFPLCGVVAYYQQLITGAPAGQIGLNLVFMLLNTIGIAFISLRIYDGLLEDTKKRGYLGQY